MTQHDKRDFRAALTNTDSRQPRSSQHAHRKEPETLQSPYSPFACRRRAIVSSTRSKRSISFCEKRLRDLKAILFDDPTDHSFVDPIEELNTIPVCTYRSDTAL